MATVHTRVIRSQTLQTEWSRDFKRGLLGLLCSQGVLRWNGKATGFESLATTTERAKFTPSPASTWSQAQCDSWEEVWPHGHVMAMQPPERPGPGWERSRLPTFSAYLKVAHRRKREHGYRRCMAWPYGQYVWNKNSWVGMVVQKVFLSSEEQRLGVNGYNLPTQREPPSC